MINEDGVIVKRNPGQRNSYVLAGKTKEDRRSRLAEVPDHLKLVVESHVRTVFAVRNFHKNNKK